MTGEQNYKPIKKPVGAVTSNSMKGTFSEHVICGI
jgi:hypothetical protein